MNIHIQVNGESGSARELADKFDFTGGRGLDVATSAGIAQNTGDVIARYMEAKMPDVAQIFAQQDQKYSNFAAAYLEGTQPGIDNKVLWFDSNRTIKRGSDGLHNTKFENVFTADCLGADTIVDMRESGGGLVKMVCTQRTLRIEPDAVEGANPPYEVPMWFVTINTLRRGNGESKNAKVVRNRFVLVAGSNEGIEVAGAVSLMPVQLDVTDQVKKLAASAVVPTP